MTPRPAVGSKITVVVKNMGHEPVFIPMWNAWTPKSPDTNTYTGTVVRPEAWLKNDEFNLTTGLKQFPVRTLAMDRVISIDGKPVSAMKKDELKVVDIKGSKANVYQVTVRNGVAEHCTCPGFKYHGGRCKHLQLATS